MLFVMFDSIEGSTTTKIFNFAFSIGIFKKSSFEIFCGRVLDYNYQLKHSLTFKSVVGP